MHWSQPSEGVLSVCRKLELKMLNEFPYVTALCFPIALD